MVDKNSSLNIAPHTWNAYTQNLNTRIVLSNCNFTLNKLSKDVNTQEGYKSFEKGRGAVVYHIMFQGTHMFKDNTGSVLYTTSSEIEFAEQSSLVCTNNTGFQRGAIT